MQVDVVGHDDGANDSHSLQQLWLATAGARGQEQTFKKCSLSWTRHYVLWGRRLVSPNPTPAQLFLPPWSSTLDPGPSNSAGGIERGGLWGGRVAPLASHLIAEGHGHNGNKESKKGFQFPQP